MMLLRASRALITPAARRSRSSARHVSAQPLGKRGVTDGSEGITLFGSEAIQGGAAPAVTVFWLHVIGDGGRLGRRLRARWWCYVAYTRLQGRAAGRPTLPVTLKHGHADACLVRHLRLRRRRASSTRPAAAARLGLGAWKTVQIVLGGFSQGAARWR